MEVYVKDRRIKPDPTKSLGKGGEADVFDIGGGLALKLFKQPNHPDLQGNPDEQRAATMRIQEHQEKLPAFPKNLPSGIVTPIDLVTTKAGQKILGYTMELIRDAEVLLRYANRGFRQAGITNEMVIEIFKKLHSIVYGTHKAGVVLGDFNDLNVMVKGTEPRIIDADSFQFGKFLCRVFTERFVDPILCDPKQNSPMLCRPYNTDSDWYAFAVMLMQCLLFVDPFGGVYRPKNPRDRIPHAARSLHRITVFRPDVVYPRPAVPYNVLPDDLLQLFHLIFEKDEREEFPLNLLEAMRWTKCTSCGTEHARGLCPECAQVVPEMVKAVTQVRGMVTATRIFQTKGLILFAACQDNELKWLYHEKDRFMREGERVVVSGSLSPRMRFRIRDRDTLIGQDGTMITFRSGETQPDKLAVDSFGTLPMFDANSRFRYWAQNGQLFRDGKLGSEYIGDVLQGQTLFWIGPNFGFGFYRAGEIGVAFVFDAEHRGINDSVKLPRLRGQLVDSTCVFASRKCWFFVATREAGKTINHCMVIKPDGALVATAQAEEGDGSWLSSLRGKCAAGDFLLAATDDGIVRVEVSGSNIVKTKEFPDTEPFVDSGCHLFPGKEGLYSVSRKEIHLLKID